MIIVKKNKDLIALGLIPVGETFRLKVNVDSFYLRGQNKSSEFCYVTSLSTGRVMDFNTDQEVVRVKAEVQILD